MQTFMPFKNFEDSAKALDNKRLNKQIVEGEQILCVLINKRVQVDSNDTYYLEDWQHAWRNHPAVKMWTGCCRALLEYVIACDRIRQQRGFRPHKSVDKARFAYRTYYSLADYDDKITYPKWLGSSAFHTSHRSNLKRKAYEDIDRYVEKKQINKLKEAITWAAVYESIWPDVPADLPYIWPTS